MTDILLMQPSTIAEGYDFTLLTMQIQISWFIVNNNQVTTPNRS